MARVRLLFYRLGSNAALEDFLEVDTSRAITVMTLCQMAERKFPSDFRHKRVRVHLNGIRVLKENVNSMAPRKTESLVIREVPAQDVRTRKGPPTDVFEVD